MSSFFTVNWTKKLFFILLFQVWHIIYTPMPPFSVFVCVCVCLCLHLNHTLIFHHTAGRQYRVLGCRSAAAIRQINMTSATHWDPVASCFIIHSLQGNLTCMSVCERARQCLSHLHFQLQWLSPSLPTALVIKLSWMRQYLQWDRGQQVLPASTLKCYFDVFLIR